MKNKKQSVQNAEDDKHEAAKGEENEENCSCSTDFLSNEDARCPICLNCLVEQEVGFPENCNHIFCMTCILKWAEIRTSCPVDRKQFKAVYKLNTSEDSVKVEIKQQICKKDDIISCNKGKNCPITMKTCKRKQENAGIHFLPILYKSWNPNYNPSNKEEVTNSVKKNKPKRQTCLNRFFKSNWYNKISSNSSFSDVSPNYQNESIEINKIDAVIRHKRRELELSCSVLARVARISSISSEAEIATCLVLETVFSISTSPLENFGSSKSGHVVTCVHEGEEKKQTSGTTGTRGTKRKVSDTTPRRRSARNIKTETSYQSQSSPKSSNSGYEASGDGSSFVNVSFTELEKLTPKRKAKRNVKQQEPLAKKKLRSSGRYGKISSDIDFDEPDETEITLLLDKGNLADSENSTFDLTHKNDVDTESSNGLENSYVAYKKEPKEHCCEGQNTLDVLKTGSYVQDPPSLVLEKTAGSCDEYLLTLEGNTEKYEEKVDTETENKLYYKNAEQDQHLNISGEQLCDDNITFTHQSPELSIPTIELPAKLESLAVTHQIIESPEKELGKTECMLIIGDISAVSRHELLGGTESMAVADKLLTGTRNELKEKLESEVIANKPVSCHTNELRKPESSAIDGILEKPITQFTEEIVKEPLDNISNEIPLHSLGVEDVEIEEKEPNIYVSNEYLKNTDLLINVSSENKLNLSFENDKPETEINTSPKMCAADIKQFNKDDSEIVSIEYNLFNIDQNASQLDHPLANDNIEQKANFLQNDSKHSVSFSNPDKKEAKESFTDKKTRTRRSRFHSPSTTWSPSKREGKRSQSPSPNREIVGEGRTSRSPKRDIFKESQRSLSKSPKRDPIISPSSSPRTENLKEKKQSLLSSPKKDHLREGRDSPTNSPKKDSIKDGISSSWTRAKESPPWHKCRSPSSDRVNDKNEFRRDNERGRSRRRWSQSRSRSRSRSRSKPRSKGPSFPRHERDGYSPPRWKERWTNDNWRSPRGSDKYKRNEQQKQTDCMKSERDSVNKEADMQSSSDQYRKDYPDWVMERINSVPETRNRERENFKNQQWEENRHNDSGASRSGNYGSGWNSNHGRGSHGRGSRGRGALTYGEQTESHWQNRKAHSRNANSSGNETSRFPEHHPYKRKAEQDFTFDTPADRSGWTSASSWAVRKTLPADVQNYYSRRGRNSSSPQSIWAKEEVASEQDPNFKDQTSQQSDASQLPVNVLQPQMNIMTPVNTQHQPMSIFPYTMGVPTPIMNIQHNPFNLPPVPMHLHSGLPLVQVAASSSVSQGPPPPPPPPPPSQQIKFIASQLDGQQLQAAPTTSHVVNSVNTTHLSALVTVESIQGPSSSNTASTNNIKSSNAAVKSMGKKINVTVEASADSSKKDQKLLIQEKAAQEVKLAIKPFYQNKDISKEEYKEIVRKAVDKVCHSKSGEVNSAKVANLVKAYVDKYKHSRKKNPDETLSVERK